MIASSTGNRFRHKEERAKKKEIVRKKGENMQVYGWMDGCMDVYRYFHAIMYCMYMELRMMPAKTARDSGLSLPSSTTTRRQLCEYSPLVAVQAVQNATVLYSYY